MTESTHPAPPPRLVVGRSRVDDRVSIEPDNGLLVTLIRTSLSKLTVSDAAGPQPHLRRTFVNTLVASATETHYFS
jgi:hypothetical protein